MCSVFGVELNFLLRREAEDGDILPGAIPSVVERCLSEVESRGLSEVGICMFLSGFQTFSSTDEILRRSDCWCEHGN